MNFLELLSLIAGMTGFIASFLEGRKAGVVGTSIGIVLGLAVGFSCFWLMRKATKWATGCLVNFGPNVQLVLGWFFLFAALMLMGGCSLVASWLTKTVIHLSS